MNKHYSDKVGKVIYIIILEKQQNTQKRCIQQFTFLYTYVHLYKT